VSQLNYIACWLPVPDGILNSIQRIIDSFVTGTLNVSRERVCLPVELGGLGMFKLSEFLGAQKCAWVARAHKLCIDNWRYNLVSISHDNNLSLLRATDIDADRHPILKNITSEFDNFRASFSAHNGNYKIAYIYENDAFRSGGVTINKQFFGHQFFRTHETRIRALRYCDCYNNDRNFKSVNVFSDSGLPMSIAVWMRLRAAMSLARTKHFKADSQKEKKSLSIESFLDTVQKGSKKFRKIQAAGVVVDLATTRTVITYNNLVNLIMPTQLKLRVCVSSWYRSYLNSDLKTFIFRFRNNTLPLTNRVHNYDAGVDPRCRYCRMRDPDTANRESFTHCFFDCEPVHNIIYNIKTLYFPGHTDQESFKYAFWYGTYSDEIGTLNQLITLNFWDIVRYTVYKFKQRRILPNLIMVRCTANFLFNTTLMKSKYIREHLCGSEEWTSFLQALG
jgi:hypothetical protein